MTLSSKNLSAQCTATSTGRYSSKTRYVVVLHIHTRCSNLQKNIRILSFSTFLYRWSEQENQLFEIEGMIIGKLWLLKLPGICLWTHTKRKQKLTIRSRENGSTNYYETSKKALQGPVRILVLDQLWEKTVFVDPVYLLDPLQIPKNWMKYTDCANGRFFCGSNLYYQNTITNWALIQACKTLFASKNTLV